MTKILAIDTSASSLSVAISDETGICGEFALDTGRTHSEVLLPMLDGLLKVSGIKLLDIAALGVTVGPGSFTGLRIGVATVKGWALAMQLPVITISSTEAMARAAGGGADILSCPLFDARRNEVYTALFEGETRIWSDDAVDPQLLALRLRELKQPVLFSGDAVDKYRELLRSILTVNYREALAERRLFMAC
ncbi:MAG: tRNA (adenosine(37)-N6)-threonylcarbamoyltransferase complex dimerization subunit type 1 TsaB, partial [Clostridiales bacterium]